MRVSRFPQPCGIGTNRDKPKGLFPEEASSNEVPRATSPDKTLQSQHLHPSFSHGCNRIHIFRMGRHDTVTQSYNVTCLKIQFEKHSLEQILLSAFSKYYGVVAVRGYPCATACSVTAAMNEPLASAYACCEAKSPASYLEERCRLRLSYSRATSG